MMMIQFIISTGMVKEQMESPNIWNSFMYVIIYPDESISQYTLELMLLFSNPTYYDGWNMIVPKHHQWNVEISILLYNLQSTDQHCVWVPC